MSDPLESPGQTQGWLRTQAVAEGPGEGVVGTQGWGQEAAETQGGLRGREGTGGGLSHWVPTRLWVPGCTGKAICWVTQPLGPSWSLLRLPVELTRQPLSVASPCPAAPWSLSSAGWARPLADCAGPLRLLGHQWWLLSPERSPREVGDSDGRVP